MKETKRNSLKYIKAQNSETNEIKVSLTSFQVNYSSNIDQIELSNLPNLNIFLLFSLFFFFFFFKQKIYLDPQPTTQFHREPSLILSTSSLGNATPFTTINRSIRYVSKKRKRTISYFISNKLTKVDHFDEIEREI